MNDYIYERAMLCRERIQGSDPFQLLRDLGIVLMISNAFAKDHLRGFCTMANGVPYVVINGNQPEEEQRVAAAHEAGHLLLHQDRLRDGVPLYDLEFCSNRSRLEQQANLFAADFLLGDCNDRLYAMVGFKLSNTLSENGTVSRGVASVDGNGYMQGVTERTGVEPYQGAVRYKDGDNYVKLTGDEPVSLNFWGFSPSIFQHIEEQFSDFLKKRIGEAGAEFYIPSVVDQLVHEGKCRVRVLDSPEKWFGMTYSQDRALVVDRIASLTKQGVYPDSLY